jgi:fructose-specific component phosphotransferase system IIB-like protein
MRCKHLAIIFDGCKGNLGLIVIGPAEIVVVMGQIIPLSGQEMWLVDEGKAEKALVTPSNQAIQPDTWLSPIKGKSVAPVIRELEAA